MYGMAAQKARCLRRVPQNVLRASKRLLGEKEKHEAVACF